MFEGLRTARGIIRSLRIYYGDRSRAAAMDRLHAGFVRRGDLVFDVGAHVGDRVASFRRLGARIVAVEPQPALVKLLRLFYGRCADVAIEAVAVGRHVGDDQPDDQCRQSHGFDGITGVCDCRARRARLGCAALDQVGAVPVTTLDALVGKHGPPAFIKIDVEGFEHEALQGLSRAVKALSFEFTIIQRDVALACIERCMALGYTRFNAALGESQTLANPDWVDGEQIARWLTRLPHAANSGDIYAALA